MSVPDTLEGWPALATGAIAVTPDGTTYTYQPNVPGGLVPPIVAPLPTDIEGYPPFSTNSLGVDADGSFWLAYPLSPDGIVDLSPAVPPPVNTVPPLLQIVSGNPTPGQTAVCSAGTWVPPPVPVTNVLRQWYLTGAAISGATGTSYLIQPSDVDGVLQCGIIAVGDGGPGEQAMSNGLTIVPADDPPETRAQPQTHAAHKTTTNKHGKTHHASGLHRRSSGASKR